MKSLWFIGCVALLILLLAACNVKQEEVIVQQDSPEAPQLISASSDPPVKENWVELNEEGGTFKIQLETLHTDEIIFWKVPTGTETWDLRVKIGTLQGEQDTWTFHWEYGEESILDHIVVELTNKHGKTTSASLFNVIKAN